MDRCEIIHRLGVTVTKKSDMKKILLGMLVVISIWGLIGCSNEQISQPWVSVEEAQKVLYKKGYEIEEKEVLLFSDGSSLEGKTLVATKKGEFLIVIEDVEQAHEESIEQAIERTYEYDYYVVYDKNIYVGTKKALKDLGIYKYINMVE